MSGRLELCRLNKDFNGFKITDLSLTVEPSQYLVVVGSTGAGKTLLLETIQGFHELDSGKILLDGVDISQLPQEQRRIAYVPQIPVFPQDNTVAEILGYGMEQVYSDATRILEGVTKMMNLKLHLNQQVVTLSGGEKRKLALARALIMQPKVLLLDEPLNNLDIISQSSLRDEIQMIHRYLDLTTIHVTHDRVEAITMADRLAVIRNGEMRAIGSVEEVYNDPRDEYAARFLGYRNIYEVKEYHHGTSYTKINIGPIVLRTNYVPDLDQDKIAVHGAEILLHRKTPVNTGDNLFQGSVTEIITTGPTSYIAVNIGVIIVLTMGRRAIQASNLRVGESVWVQFSVSAVKPIRS